MPLVVFSHANSFPASTYRVLFADLQRRGFTVEAIDKYGHDPAYPVSNNWPRLVQHLADFCWCAVRAARRAGVAGRPFTGRLSEPDDRMPPPRAGRPRRARGAAAGFAGRGGLARPALGLAKRTQLVGRVAMSPASVSKKRRHHWPSTAEALAHFRAKKLFARWDAEVLADYVEHGTADTADGRRTLAFDRDVETAIYSTLPDNLESLLRRTPPRCPVAFIGGRQSAEVRQVGLAMTERITKGRMMMLDGGHLFPMERPRVAGAAIEAALLNLAG